MMRQFLPENSKISFLRAQEPAPVITSHNESKKPQKAGHSASRVIYSAAIGCV
jgi:hypothetical protein